MHLAEPMEIALGDHGLAASVGVPANTPGAVQVVALCRHKVDGAVAHGGQTYWLPRVRAEAGVARDIVHIMGTGTHDWYGSKGRILSPFAGDKEDVFAKAPSAGSLKIVGGCGYDPGAAGYRTHSAINQTTKHASAFARYADENPHCSLRQLDGLKDAATVRDALLTADVLHCHMNYMLAANAGSQFLPEHDPKSSRPVNWRNGQWVVRHYHGSRPDNRTTMEHDVDAKVRERVENDGGGLIRLGARLTICAEKDAEDVSWLPIPIPVKRYRELRAEMCIAPPYMRESDGPFRIAHSPTKRDYKGTGKFMAACKALKAKGLNVEPLLIENMSHGEALRMKAQADACFDSFWLGIQGSGLEAAAMGMPVIAGDADVRELYQRHVGECPYTFAGDQQGIANAIERLATDATFYTAEALRLDEYVVAYHDYPAVGKRYEKILAEAMNRPDIITTAPARKRGKAA